MYVVHVVQAHANVRTRAHSCGVAHSAHGASRASRHMLHTQSSSSNREQHIIYLPPPQEHQALVSISSNSRSLAFRPQSGPMPLATIHPASSNTTSPQLRKAAGMLAKLVAPWQRTTALTAAKSGGSNNCSSSGKAFSAGKLAAGQMIICLPDGTGLLLNSSTISPTAAGDPKPLQGWPNTSNSSSSSAASCKLPAAAFPAAVMLHQPAAAAVAHPNKRALISRTSCSSAACVSLQRRAQAHPPAAAWVQHWLLTPAATATALKAATSAQPWSQSSAGVAACDAGWSAASSSKVTATPAFSIPGYYYTPSSSSAFGAGGPDWGNPLGGGSGSRGSGSDSNSKPLAGKGSGTAAGGRPAAAAAAAAAGGGRVSSFGVLAAAPVRLAKLGVGLMGLAAVAALASMCWDDSRRARDDAPAPSSAVSSTNDAAGTSAAAISVAAAAAVDEMHGAAAAAGAVGPAAADTPGFHEWMVRRLQATLQQFDAEQKLLQKELQMLQALSSSKSKLAGNSTAAAMAHSVLAAGGDAAGSSSSTAAWSRVKRWLGFTGNSGSSAAAEQHHAAAVGGSGDPAGEWTPAGIAARAADIREQIESLDVLKAALAAEAAEQQRQQLRAEAAHG